MNKVRAILREADEHAHVRSTLPRPRALTLVLGYAGWNAAASAYDHRVVGKEAAAQLAADGNSGEVNVRLHRQSFQMTAELSSSRGGDGIFMERSVNSQFDQPKPRKRVWVLPHLFVTDAFFGRSSWVLTCSKANGHTKWHSGPDGEIQLGEERGSGFSWSSSSSSSSRRE